MFLNQVIFYEKYRFFSTPSQPEPVEGFYIDLSFYQYVPIVIRKSKNHNLDPSSRRDDYIMMLVILRGA